MYYMNCFGNRNLSFLLWDTDYIITLILAVLEKIRLVDTVSNSRFYSRLPAADNRKRRTVLLCQNASVLLRSNNKERYRNKNQTKHTK